MDNLKLKYLMEGVGKFASILFDKLQRTPRNDSYILLFRDDLNKLFQTALDQVNKEVENG